VPGRDLDADIVDQVEVFPILVDGVVNVLKF
jgi:hypothetical protein